MTTQEKIVFNEAVERFLKERLQYRLKLVGFDHRNHSDGSSTREGAIEKSFDDLKVEVKLRPWDFTVDTEL